MINFIRKYFTFILVTLVFVFAGSSFYFYQQFNKIQESPEKVSQEEAKDLAIKVGKLMVLPTDETPTLATVSNPEALIGQSFFIGAKKGDKVLIYSNAKKAVLYDPVLNKIIATAPLNVGDAQSLNVKGESVPTTKP